MQNATPATESRPRPTVVTAAVALMLLVAAVGAVGAVMGLIVMGGIRDALLEAAQDVDQRMADAMSGFLTISIVVGIGFSLLIVTAFVVLAFFVSRGVNAARITTWAFAGVYLFCGICGLASQGLGSFAPQPGDDADADAMARALEAATPGWYNTATVVINLVDVLAYIAIIVLLALPAANAFFTKPAPQWQPPAEFGGPMPPAGWQPYGVPPVAPGQPPMPGPQPPVPGTPPGVGPQPPVPGPPPPPEPGQQPAPGQQPPETSPPAQ